MLLDTHVCLWLLGPTGRLGPGARDAIVGASAVRVSAVSVAEVEIKRLTGRLDAPADFLAAMVSAGVRELALTGEHAAGVRELPGLARHDPFDRLLLAQAVAERIPLLTADRRLLSLGLDTVVDARR